MMKKNNPHKKTTYRSKTAAPPKVQEPAPAYKSVRAVPAVKDFTYTEFKKIADKSPFTQAEWAAMLHVSERTLQRYARNNGSFATINAERAVQIAQVLKAGKEAFGDTAKFYHWLKSNPQMLEGPLSLQSLTSHEGINQVLTELGRITHGILA